MILLQIQSISKYTPVKWPFESLTALSEGQGYISFGGKHPHNPEHGTLTLAANIIEGTFEGITQVFLAQEDGRAGKLLNWKKRFWGGYNVELDFNTVFAHGLRYSARHFIPSGSFLIGLTPQEQAALNTFEQQRKLLALLVGQLLPSRKSEVLQSALPAFLCLPNDEQDEHFSHFLGAPKHPQAALNNDAQQLLHLATFHRSDFPEHDFFKKLKPQLSFYLRTRETEIAWPEGKQDFKVFNDESRPGTDKAPEFSTAHNFEIRNLLDLPGYDHTLLRVHQFTKEEREKYNQLREVYMAMVIGELESNEVNKLFGYPDSVQNCVSYEAERVFNQRPYSDDIYADAVQWTLLLQVSPYCKWFDFFDYFGDGTIYYMIRKADLENGNFERCQVIVQHT